MKKIVKRSLLLLLLLSLVGVGYAVLTFQAPVFVGIESFTLGELADDEAPVQVKARLFNPNFFPLSAKSLDYTLAFENTLIAKGSLPEGIALSAKDTSLLDLPASLNLDGFFQVYEKMLASDPCQLVVHLDGRFTFLGIPYSMDFPVSISPDGLTKDIMEQYFDERNISFGDWKWKPKSVSQSEVSFTSTIKNPLNISTRLEGVDLSFSAERMKGKSCGRWQLDEALPLPARKEVQIPGTVLLEHLPTGKGLLKGVFKGKIRYHVWGTARLGLGDYVFELPITGAVVYNPLRQTGHWES